MRDLLKPLLWLYLVLLVAEGALRKWVVPGLAEPLLIVRDPVVIAIYVAALAAGVFPWRPAVLLLGVFGMLSLVFAVVAGIPTFVALYGLRINYLHVPLVFVMAGTLTHADVVRLGRLVLWLTPPIALLMFLQYRASPGSWLNYGIGGSEEGQLAGALGKTRPPGPFAFISGPVCWFALAAAFAIDGWLHRRRHPFPLLLAATGAIVIAIPISISRSVLFAVLVVGAFGLVAVLRDLRRIGALLPLAALVALVLAFALRQDLGAAFGSRWENSTVAHGGIGDSLVNRFLGDHLNAFDVISRTPLWGRGIGLGSNIGARYTTGDLVFVLAEGEWPKILLELGPILGLAFILYRCWLAGLLVSRGLGCLLRHNETLAWMLAGAAVLNVVSGQWAPPTILGFSVFVAGLALAAATGPEPESEDDPEEDADTEAETTPLVEPSEPAAPDAPSSSRTAACQAAPHSHRTSGFTAPDNASAPSPASAPAASAR